MCSQNFIPKIERFSSETVFYRLWYKKVSPFWLDIFYVSPCKRTFSDFYLSIFEHNFGEQIANFKQLWEGTCIKSCSKHLKKSTNKFDFWIDVCGAIILLTALMLCIREMRLPPPMVVREPTVNLWVASKIRQNLSWHRLWKIALFPLRRNITFFNVKTAKKSINQC